MRNPSFWDMSVEEAMGCDMPYGDAGRTPVRDSDTIPSCPNDTYYSRGHIAQLSLHEPTAEQLLEKLK